MAGASGEASAQAVSRRRRSGKESFRNVMR
jgi:hypothetical protein